MRPMRRPKGREVSMCRGGKGCLTGWLLRLLPEERAEDEAIHNGLYEARNDQALVPRHHAALSLELCGKEATTVLDMGGTAGSRLTFTLT